MTDTAAVAASREFVVAAANRLPVLYDLALEWRDLVGLLEQPAIDQEAVSTELARVAQDIRAKAYGIATVVQGIDNKVSQLKNEEARLAAKRKTYESAGDRLRAYTLAQMQIIGEDRIDTGTFLLTIRTNPPACTVVDAALVPHEYERTKITIDVDRRAILEHYKSTGEIPPGVSITRGERLEMR